MSLVGIDLLGNLPEWQERALCAQTDPEAFFPEKGGSTREAKRICNRCEVKAECLEYALGHDERFGIWGGLSERERRRPKRKGDVGDVTPPDPPRVVRIRRLAAAGMTNVEIAREEGIKPGSVGAICRQHGIAARSRKQAQPVGGGAG